MYDARQIANWFIQRAARDGKTLTIMQLLKLVYIAHGWFLETSGSPLIRNRIEAWKHGPVIPDVYNAFRKQGITIGSPINDFNAGLSYHAESIVEYVYNTYSGLSAGRLSEMTHERNGPWDLATKAYGFFAPIDNDTILSHYRQKRAQYVANQ
ncbi:MAG TPA: type II toxin-antitoxin system antitoxin SocA domain-containing protein [Pseudochrobactrum sp.]|nr:type II toxin-antitoxin system antitoxin SocA domain-containing protein [Pseudochrobactrum sp.]